MKTATTKTCTKCGEEQPLTEYNKKKQNKKDGLHNHCRTCVNTRKREVLALNRDHINQQARERYARLTPEQKRIRSEVNKAWRSENRDKLLADKKAYYKANKKRCNKQTLDYYYNNKKAIQEWRRKNYAENKEAILKRNRAYRQKNLEKVVAIEQAKASRRRATESDNHTLAELHAYWRANGIDPKRCTYCDAWHTKWSNNWKTSQGDHVVPLARGGKDFVENSMPCCLSCNCSKRHLLLGEEWIPPKDR